LPQLLQIIGNLLRNLPWVGIEQRSRRQNNLKSFVAEGVY